MPESIIVKIFDTLVEVIGSSINVNNLVLVAFASLTIVIPLYIMYRRMMGMLERTVKALGVTMNDNTRSIRFLANVVMRLQSRTRDEEIMEMLKRIEGRLSQILVGQVLRRYAEETAREEVRMPERIEHLEELVTQVGLKSATIITEDGLLVETTIEEAEMRDKEAAEALEIYKSAFELMRGGDRFALDNGSEILLLFNLGLKGLYAAIRGDRKLLSQENTVRGVMKLVKDYVKRRYG
ncbi:MAG: hypothetical protein DRN15_00785 [Thermoprotei archaeon]|nr:MAG: hypothetical protein DRM97_04045 [Thermoprotei archaeon]RLF25221.1 MAG: hypothetical protein DRN15_00785 [Thermoprotei archaeon]